MSQARTSVELRGGSTLLAPLAANDSTNRHEPGQRRHDRNDCGTVGRGRDLRARGGRVGVVGAAAPRSSWPQIGRRGGTGNAARAALPRYLLDPRVTISLPPSRGWPASESSIAVFPARETTWKSVRATRSFQKPLRELPTQRSDNCSEQARRIAMRVAIRRVVGALCMLLSVSIADAADHEVPQDRSAKDILEPGVLKGPHYHIRDLVLADGYMD